jgi:HAD superfamily hydrolase (TIGR01549 family)
MQAGRAGKTVRGLTLDLGCTMIYESSCEGDVPSNVTVASAESIAGFLRETGYSVELTDVLRAESSWDDFLSRYYSGSIEVSLELKISYILSRLGVKPSPLLVEEALRRVFKAYAETRVAYGDVKRFLEGVKELGLKIAIISNTNSHAGYIETLKKLGLADYFDLVVTSHIAVYKKPLKEIFRITADLLGLSPDQIIHIGDSLADVQGALSSGYADAIELARNRECKTRTCCKSLDEALEYIKARYFNP